MSTWLYAAAASKADASQTLDLASRHGLIWRPFYADRTPRQAIPLVRRLAAGDSILLGYRDAGGLRLMARARIGLPDAAIRDSPVFTEVPASLLPVFKANNYSPDPVLGTVVGIFVEEVEPIEGFVPGPLPRGTIFETGGSSSVQEDETPVKSPSLPVHAPVSPGATHWLIGIDVGGRQSKGYDLCAVEWLGGTPVSLKFASRPHRVALADSPTLRSAVAAGDVSKVAALTYDAASAAAADVWDAITALAASPDGIFVDAPSGFSRNENGHGRLTEKASLRGVSFQSTPSLSCGREHGGTWAWMLFGFAAFAACLNSGRRLSLDDWKDGLQSGFYRNSSARRAPVVRECFPTATIAVLRERCRIDDVRSRLASVASQAAAEVDAVSQYLEHGVWAVKRPRQALFDRADALVAALSGLPLVDSAYSEEQLVPQRKRTWSSKSDPELEGFISVPA